DDQHQERHRADDGGEDAGPGPTGEPRRHHRPQRQPGAAADRPEHRRGHGLAPGAVDARLQGGREGGEEQAGHDRDRRPQPHRALVAHVGKNRAMTQTTGTFTRMDESTAEQWGVIVEETFAHQDRVAESVLGLLRNLAGITDGFAVDQLTHSLQTATLAERAGADDELVVAALCHDIGKAVSVANHPRISAEILRPYVSDDVDWMIQVHQDFQGRHYYAHLGADPDARDQHRGHPAYALAARFADEWDQQAFDPEYDTLPLE